MSSIANALAVGRMFAPQSMCSAFVAPSTNVFYLAFHTCMRYCPEKQKPLVQSQIDEALRRYQQQEEDTDMPENCIVQ